jgi:hypothetical protein
VQSRNGAALDKDGFDDDFSGDEIFLLLGNWICGGRGLSIRRTIMPAAAFKMIAKHRRLNL